MSITTWRRISVHVESTRGTNFVVERPEVCFRSVVDVKAPGAAGNADLFCSQIKHESVIE